MSPRGANFRATRKGHGRSQTTADTRVKAVTPGACPRTHWSKVCSRQRRTSASKRVRPAAARAPVRRPVAQLPLLARLRHGLRFGTRQDPGRLPPTFRDWDKFEDYAEALVAIGNIPDWSWFWWDVRPHPRHGTVERYLKGCRKRQCAEAYATYRRRLKERRNK